MSVWLYKISLYLAFLPILIALFRYKYLSNPFWWYFLGLLVGKICGVISIKLGEQHFNNHFMMYVNAGLLLIFQSIFFYQILESKFSKKVLLFFIVAYYLGMCLDIFLHGIYMNQYLFMILDVWQTVYCLIILNQILKDESIESLRQDPLFWIILGTLFYTIFDFILSVSSSWLYAVNRTFFFLIWDFITPIFMLFKTILVSVGYWKTKNYAQNLIYA
jgi:uncharacterized membrane protein